MMIRAGLRLKTLSTAGLKIVPQAKHYDIINFPIYINTNQYYIIYFEKYIKCLMPRKPIILFSPREELNFNKDNI